MTQARGEVIDRIVMFDSKIGNAVSILQHNSESIVE